MNRPYSPDRPLLSIAETARALGSSEKTVRRMIAAGELPATRYRGRLIRIHPDDIERAGKPVTRLALDRGDAL